MKTNILLILGHPSENSFCNALLDAYKKGAATTGANYKTLYISQLDFNVNLADGYKTGETLPLEEDLIRSQELISWADHIVLAYPNWWGFMPAITKGFIDRIFMPGFAFKHHSGKIFPEKLCGTLQELQSLNLFKKNPVFCSCSIYEIWKPTQKILELNGIEPSTLSLRTTRSPN